MQFHFSVQMYHRQIFKILLSNRVLDEPRQRRLFKTSDLVELFNLNEPIDGEFSESDRLFRESKLTPATGGFSHSKIEEMRKLASRLSKKISATAAAAKSTRDEDKSANDGTHERKNDKQNNNLRCNEVAAVAEDGSSENQTLLPQQTTAQESSHERNEDNSNSDAVIRKDSNVENNDTSKNNFEQNTTPMKSANDNFVEKEGKIVSSDDKVKSRRHKKSKKRNISAMFEGERVSCLIGRRLGRPEEKEDSVSTADDDYVLRKLFAKSSNQYI